MLHLQTKQENDRSFGAIHRDDLTGLYLHSSLQKKTGELKRKRKLSGTLMFMFVDADNLKRINDSLGHKVGDEAIKLLARLLKSSIPQNALACRKGGDEFLAVVPVENETHGISIVTKLLSGIRERHLLCGHFVEMTCSIGLTFSNEAKFDFLVEERRADIAMYFSKMNGKNQFKAYCSEDCKSIELVHDLSLEFPAALRFCKLTCAFQPIYAMRERQVVGCEALVRWCHDRFGSVPANKIIEIAKNAGEMKNLTRAVLKMACSSAAAWPEEVYLSVNFAASDFLQEDCSESTLKTITDFGVHPGRLRIEITETELLELNETVRENIQSLRNVGVRIGIDDFGTGYSSMGSLDQFPADFLKIDRSLVSDCRNRDSSKIFIRAIRQVAQKQSLEVIAEGVENVNEAATLQGCGVSFAQGYYYQKPTAHPDLSSWLKPDYFSGSAM